VYANRTRATAKELMLRFGELEAVIRSPRAIGTLDKAEGLAMYIARSAPSGQVANLAMLVMSAAIDLRANRQPDADGRLDNTLSRLRTALEQMTV
jgi:hypothetical protein